MDDVTEVLEKVRSRWLDHTGLHFIWHRTNDGSVAVGLGPRPTDEPYWRAEACDGNPYTAVRMAMGGWMAKAARVDDFAVYREIMGMLPVG